MFLLVLAYPGSPRRRVIKWLMFLFLCFTGYYRRSLQIARGEVWPTQNNPSGIFMMISLHL